MTLYDLSDDDQGGFPECEGGREKSERSLRNMGRQLADQAIYDVRLCFAVSRSIVINAYIGDVIRKM